MRDAINTNPLVQVALIAGLGVIVAFMLVTRMSGGDEATDPAAGEAVVGAESTLAPAPSTEPKGAAKGSARSEPEPGAGAPAGEFAAGPGLPLPVVSAHARGDTVVLLVTRAAGIDDAELNRLGKRLAGEPKVSFFHTYARDVAKYSRVVSGVDIDRAPALIAISPRTKRSQGQPVASVTYGYRGYESVRQVARDAAYRGKQLGYDPG